MKTYNLYTLIIKFFKNTPIITLLSFVLIVFTAVLTTFFPKYSSIFVSEIYRMDTDIFSNELIKLVSIYLFIWLGVLIHFYIIHTKLLVKSRSFFLEELFIPIWNKLEKGELPQNSTSTIIKNIFTIVTNNTILIQGLIFITIPAICSEGRGLHEIALLQRGNNLLTKCDWFQKKCQPKFRLAKVMRSAQKNAHSNHRKGCF